MEFFAGGGLARAGLGEQWRCLVANDIDSKKAAVYRENWGSAEFVEADIRDLDDSKIDEAADLAWASFPCQDVSQAGAGAGLEGERSGTFWPFWRVIRALADRSLPPKIIVLENVCGMVTSHGGSDFDAICSALNEADYRLGAIIIDACLFVPQSRPRVFLIAVRRDLVVPLELTSVTPKYFHTDAIQRFVSEHLSIDIADWIWWDPAPPKQNVQPIATILEHDPTDVKWHSHEETCTLLKMMSAHTLKKLGQMRRKRQPCVGTIYRRMRPKKGGGKVQRAEVRFDGISGCLRAPTGGSSRQILLFVDGNNIRSRLLSSREAARLMGLSDEYALPDNYYDAYRVSGEGVAVPVVDYLSECLIQPVLRANA